MGNSGSCRIKPGRYVKNGVEMIGMCDHWSFKRDLYKYERIEILVTWQNQ